MERFQDYNIGFIVFNLKGYLCQDFKSDPPASGRKSEIKNYVN